MKKTNHIAPFETFSSKGSINESQFGKGPNPGRRPSSSPQFNSFSRRTPEAISKNGLKSVITQDFFLDLWFDSYFKNTTGDLSYDYRNDEDFWNHTDEILTPETGEEIETLRNPTVSDSYHDSHWSLVLNYISSQRPNPLTETDALEDAIDSALYDFKSSRRR
jgi:hypothetical protein